MQALTPAAPGKPLWYEPVGSRKLILRMMVDLLMTVCLLGLISFMLTGQQYHFAYYVSKFIAAGVPVHGIAQSWIPVWSAPSLS